MNKIFMAVGLVIALAGVVFSFLPHEWHNALLGAFVPQEHADNDAGMEHEHGGHETHQIIGWVMALIGLSMQVAGWKIFD